MRKEVGLLIIIIVGLLLSLEIVSSSSSSDSSRNRNKKVGVDENNKNKERENSKLLRFNRKGEFKILQISDMHYANGKDTPCMDVLPSQMEACSDLNTTHYLRRFIQTENPDLIVFTGDNVHSIDAYNYNRSMDEVFAAAIESNIPWAAILGNRDVDVLVTGISRKAVMEYITGMKNTVSLLNPSNLRGSESESIWGWGNYNLEVLGVENSPLQNKSLLNLYLLDSGDYTYSLPPDTYYMGYDWIHPSQQSWFLNTSKQLQQQSPTPAPGLAFFHIPIPEFNNITESDMVGVKQEPVHCPTYNSGFFQTMVEAGDVKAAFVGHGHVNDFCGKLCDIHLCFDAGFGYHGYGLAGWPRRARVINVKLHNNNNNNWGPVHSITTWKRIHDQHLTLIDPQLLWTSTTTPPTTTAGSGDQAHQSFFNPIMTE